MPTRGKPLRELIGPWGLGSTIVPELSLSRTRGIYPRITWMETNSAGVGGGRISLKKSITSRDPWAVQRTFFIAMGLLELESV